MSATPPTDDAPPLFGPWALGTWGLASDAYGKPTPDDIFLDTLREAVRSGVGAIDTAPLWGGGRSERVVGAGLRELGDEAADIPIIGRVGRRIEDGAATEDFVADALKRDAESALERLGRDQLGAALLHNPPANEASDWEALVAAVGELKAQGLAARVGASVQTGDQAIAAIDAGLDLLCLPVNVLQLGAVRAAVEHAPEVSILARSPLLHGVMTAAYPSGHVFPPNEHRRQRWTEDALRVRLHHVRALRPALDADASDFTTLSLRFVFAEPGVETTIVGCRSTSHVAQVASAVEGPELPADTRAGIETLLSLAGG